MQNHSCLCLQCGRAFEIVLEDNADISKQNCPVCGGDRLIRHNPQASFNSLFGFTGGG